MNFQELDQTIKNHIAKDEIAEAIQLLNDSFKDHPVVNDIILQSGRYESLKKDQLNGTIDYKTLQTYLNQLRSNILVFVQAQKTSFPIEPKQEDENNTIEQEMKLSLARISILWLLQDTQQDADGMTITEIYQTANTKSRKFIVEGLKEMESNKLIAKTKVGKSTYWKLTERGRKLATKFEAAKIWGR